MTKTVTGNSRDNKEEFSTDEKKKKNQKHLKLEAIIAGEMKEYQ